MSDTSGTNDKTPPDDESVVFDETNGLAPGLDGDDGGSVKAEDDDLFLGNLTRVFDERTEQTGETSYSEEGQP